MKLIEILVIIISILIVLSVIILSVINRKKGKGCSCCSQSKNCNGCPKSKQNILSKNDSENNIKP